MFKNKTTHEVYVILIFGILTGILTSFGQTYIPDPFKQLANSYSVWLLLSFVAGLYIHKYRYAIIGGALIQYLAIAFYYVSSITRLSSGFSLSSNLVWILGGTIMGPIVGFLSLYLKNKQKYDYLAPSFIAGLFLSESMYQFINLKYYSEGFIFAILGTLVLIILLRMYKTNVTKTVVATLFFSILMYAGFGKVLTSIFS